MALVILYSLSGRDVRVLSNRSHPSPMLTTTPSSSRSPAVKPSQTTSFLSRSTQSVLKAPERKHGGTRSVSVQDPAPMSNGTPILWKLEPDTDRTRERDSVKYEQYIAQDFKRHWVFVDIDVFMKHVLHIPKNWKELWNTTIRYIRRHQNFLLPHWDYAHRCETQRTKELEFYRPLADMGNAIIELSELSKDESVKARTRQCYLMNDPGKVLGRVMRNLSPDIVAVFE